MVRDCARCRGTGFDVDCSGVAYPCPECDGRGVVVVDA